MVQVLGTGAEAEQVQVYGEARSVLGSLVTQLIAIVRQILQTVLNLTSRVIAYASEHPLALTLLTVNLMIWVS